MEMNVKVFHVRTTVLVGNKSEDISATALMALMAPTVKLVSIFSYRLFDLFILSEIHHHNLIRALRYLLQPPPLMLWPNIDHIISAIGHIFLILFPRH